MKSEKCVQSSFTAQKQEPVSSKMNSPKVKSPNLLWFYLTSTFRAAIPVDLL